MKPNALLIDPRDDVVTVLETVDAEDTVRWARGGHVSTRQKIPVGHKVAIRPIAAGSAIHKYGYTIGTAAVAIAAGDHVHTHNLNAAEA